MSWSVCVGKLLEIAWSIDSYCLNLVTEFKLTDKEFYLSQALFVNPNIFDLLSHCFVSSHILIFLLVLHLYSFYSFVSFMLSPKYILSSSAVFILY